jgi:hypothetical protein
MRIDAGGPAGRILESAMTLINRSKPPVLVFACTGDIDAQRFLMEQGYTLWRLTGYRRRRAPLTAPVATDGATIVAKRV